MELIKIINARKVINDFAETENISARLAYQMTKFIMSTQTEAEFYAKEMKKLFEKHGTKCDSGEVSILPENVSKFLAEAKKIEETEVDDPKIKFLLSEMLELKLSMKQIYPLMDFIKDDEEAN